VIEPSLTIEQGYPVLNVSDVVTNRPIARALYRMQDAQFIQCGTTTSCDAPSEKPSIRTGLFDAAGTEYTWKTS